MNEQHYIQLINTLNDRIEKLEKRIKRLENRAVTTVPIYDSTNFPEDAIEGQVVIADAGS
jgi:16S rRNA C967 or C1407 C5-methylase (RsmB/RsmF family)